MRDLNQLILEFKFDRNFKDQDFYVSGSNESAYKIINSWPNWERKFLNICGEKFSGKSHLVNIFEKKYGGMKIDSKDLKDNFVEKIKSQQNIVIENLDQNINEDLLYSIYNLVDLNDKFLLTTSILPINKIGLKLQDLKSRCDNFLIYEILNPDDNLIYALIIKNLSDRQILIDKKLVEYIIKRINRSYGKISEFIYKIDQLSLKEKKPIDFKIIKKALEIN
jgi:chromosomal replication initiation ATPase DnaA